MVDRARALPVAPPRRYTLRDAYRGRVWRDPGSMIARDLLWLALALALAGLAYDELAFMLLGGLGAGLAVAVAALATLLTNRRRVRLIRRAPAARGTLGRAKRVILLHEFFRGARERTFAVPYRFAAPDGATHRGTLWICGCARDRLVEGQTEWIVFDPDRPRRSLPLRAAMMVAPH